MSSNDSFTARGIEFGDVVWQFLPYGIIMGRSKRKPGVHYSLHLGHRSGVLDFHKTDENAIGKERYETLSAIRWEDAARLLTDIQPLFVEAAFDLYQPLRIGCSFTEGFQSYRACS